ncbi:MAG TPA: sugar ABC transporter permease [Microcella sp.]|nr:sugar ABC transporter permease [Microcella sp.]
MRALVRGGPLVPAAILLAVFLIVPILWAFVGSFSNATLTGVTATSPGWVGTANYERLFADPDFGLSLWLTVVFTVVSAVIGQNVLGFAIALTMTRAHPRMAAIGGGVVVLAWVLPEIVAAFVAYAFFSRDGTLNQLLGLVGLTGDNWLFIAPMATIIVANVWRGTAFSMLIYRAALAEVPPELIEAAEIDGANAWQRLVRVTLPVLRGTIATTLMLITLQTLSVFTLIYVMTAGGPGNASSTLPVFAYQEAFRFGSIAYGTAIATVMLVIGAVFSLGYIAVLRRAEADR